MTGFNTARNGRWRYSGGSPGADWRLDRVLWMLQYNEFIVFQFLVARILRNNRSRGVFVDTGKLCLI
jgi:hypothetical protein